jgi:hypothetical protein
MMTREEKIELIQRMLGLQHKLKVHDSVKSPTTHEEWAASHLARWELEDEITAIEKLLAEDRQHSVKQKQKQIEETYLSGSLPPKKKT